MCSQQHTTGPYPEPENQVHTLTPSSLRTILILSSFPILGPRKCVFLSSSPTEEFVWIYNLFHACYIPRWLHHSWFDHHNNISKEFVQVRIPTYHFSIHQVLWRGVYIPHNLYSTHYSVIWPDWNELLLEAACYDMCSLFQYASSERHNVCSSDAASLASCTCRQETSCLSVP